MQGKSLLLRHFLRSSTCTSRVINFNRFNTHQPNLCLYQQRQHQFRCYSTASTSTSSSSSYHSLNAAAIEAFKSATNSNNNATTSRQIQLQQRAIELASEAIATRPDLPTAYINRGFFYVQQPIQKRLELAYADAFRAIHFAEKQHQRQQLFNVRDFVCVC